MDRKFKICMIAPIPPPYGGIANWTLLMKNYISNRSDIELNMINTAPKNRSTDGRTLWDRVFIGGIDIFYKIKELSKVIKSFNPDIVHITTSGQLAILRDICLLKFAKKKIFLLFII